MIGLGKRIRELRKQRKLTLVDISGKTGIDKATLCRIEKGRMSGTLQSHLRIADALGIRLPDLYQQVLDGTHIEKDKRLKEKLDKFSHSGGATSELLTSGVLNKKMLPVLLRLKAGGRTETEEHPVTAERFVYVLTGEIEIRIDDQPTPLKAGESLYFSADKPHTIRNTARSESRCLSIMTPTSL